MQCVKDPEQLNLWGNKRTQNTRYFMIAFEKCDAKNHNVVCDDDEVINKWISGKYIFTIVNQKKFVSHRFDEQKI